MSNEFCISTWVHLDSASQESRYPQVAGRSSSSSFQRVYLRCVATFFATSVRNNPEARHVLFTNAAQFPAFDDFDLIQFLDDLDVEITRLTSDYFPPREFYGAWRNQFYVFDIISYIASNAQPDDRWLVLDSDCVWIRDGRAIERAIGEHGLLTYLINYPVDWEVNGLTRLDMQEIYEDIGKQALVSPPLYFGGEIYAATGSVSGKVARELDTLWHTTLSRFKQQKNYFREEAHALSYLYSNRGFPAGTANAYIKRMYTGLPFQYHTALGADYGLAVWHLPLEKKWGLKRLFDDVRRPTSEFWRIDIGRPFAEYLGHILGIPRRTTSKLIKDSAAWAAGKASQLLGK